jgi:hypothetical protein
MFFSPWYSASGNEKKDGVMVFQADGAAHHQARGQEAAGDKRTRSRDIMTKLT